MLAMVSTRYYWLIERVGSFGAHNRTSVCFRLMPDGDLSCTLRVKLSCKYLLVLSSSRYLGEYGIQINKEAEAAVINIYLYNGKNKSVYFQLRTTSLLVHLFIYIHLT